MLAVIFEVTPLDGQRAALLRHCRRAAARAASASTASSRVERFESLTRPGVFLSLSYWRDEAAIAQWRNLACHRDGQREGRDAVFADYSIRVMSCVRAYGMHDRAQAPADSQAALF